MGLLSKISILALDFDGVILESNDIKHQAFKKIFSRYPEKLDELMNYHMAHPATVRFEKFEHAAKSILQLEGPAAEKIINAWADEFENLTEEAILNCDFVVGAHDFLNHFQGEMPIYLLSATPTQILDKILEKRDLKKYFKRVHGGPLNKAELLEEISSLEKVSPEEILFIGDSPSDLVAAQIASTQFIGRKSDYELDTPVAKNDLEEILQYILKEA